MGNGSFNFEEYRMYSRSCGRVMDDSGRTSGGQGYTAYCLDESLNPLNKIRECCISEEHPNPIPIILALDVTGSMGEACRETAESLGVIMKNLYGKYQDIEFMVMGIGDLSYDDAPLQVSQFESDIRIAEALDKIWMEHGGGGNGFESYSAAWYFGLYNTKLESFDQNGQKGIIITMGDEPMNPYLPKKRLNQVLGTKLEADVETKDLYKAAKEKFDIYHIAIDDDDCCYSSYQKDIENSFGQLLGPHYKVSTIEDLSGTICECIDESLGNGTTNSPVNENGNISW